MNWKKKLLALGLSLTLTLSLTACGQKTSEPEQPEEPTQTEEPADKTQNGTEAVCCISWKTEKRCSLWRT